MATAEGKIIKLIDDVAARDKLVGIFAPRPEVKKATELYSVGTATLIVRMFKLPDGSIRAFLKEFPVSS